MAQHKCVMLGHEWTVTASPGWFLCQRIIGLKMSKTRDTHQSVYCGAISYCPGCLGYRLNDGYLIVMCQNHATMNIHHLPFLSSTPSTPCSPAAAHQHSLW